MIIEDVGPEEGHDDSSSTIPGILLFIECNATLLLRPLMLLINDIIFRLNKIFYS